MNASQIGLALAGAFLVLCLCLAIYVWRPPPSRTWKR